MNSDQPTWLRRLPLGLLGLATAVALAANPAFGDGAVDPSVLLTLACVAGAWIAVFTFAVPDTPRHRQVMFVGRTALAFVLAWLNPFFAIFALIGFIDAFDAFDDRRAYAGVLVTAVIMAGSQSGGLPPRDGLHWTVFGALLVLNGGLSVAFTQLGRRVEATSEERAETIGELERLNADLERAVAENEALHQTVLAQARDAGVQEERQRLARDIHDTIAQDLAGIVAQLQASHEEADPLRRRAMIDQATELARSSLTEARRSVLDLSPAPLDGTSLSDAMAELVSSWGPDHDTKADLAVTGECRRLHCEVESTLLRVAQEALANVAKHAQASRVGVTVTYLDDEVILDVRDDGSGFSPDAAQGSGFGLRSMHQRVERLAGCLHIESRTGQGSVISARLPALPQEPA